MKTIHFASGRGVDEATEAMQQGALFAAEQLEEIYRFLDGGIGLRWGLPEDATKSDDSKIEGPRLYQGDKLIAWIDVILTEDENGHMNIRMEAHNADEQDVRMRLLAAGALRDGMLS